MEARTKNYALDLSNGLYTSFFHIYRQAITDVHLTGLYGLFGLNADEDFPIQELQITTCHEPVVNPKVNEHNLRVIVTFTTSSMHQFIQYCEKNIKDKYVRCYGRDLTNLGNNTKELRATNKKSD